MANNKGCAYANGECPLQAIKLGGCKCSLFDDMSMCSKNNAKKNKQKRRAKHKKATCCNPFNHSL